MGILNNIRQKPDHQKKIISLVTAVILTLFIVGFWFSFSRTSETNTDAQAEDKLSSLSPMQVIKDEFSKAFSAAKVEMPGTSSSSTVEIIEASSTGTTSTSSVNQ